MTAHYLAFDSYPIEAGDWVVVHAAAGGVGLLLTQLAKLRGGRVIATTSSDEKAALARGAGADEVIGYDDFAERVRELTDGEGAAAIYDGIGKTTFLDGPAGAAPARADDSLRRRERPARSARPADARAVPVRCTYSDRRSTPTRARLRSCASAVSALFELIAAGKLDVRIGGRYPLAKHAARTRTSRRGVPPESSSC